MIKLFSGEDESLARACIEAENRLAVWQNATPAAAVTGVQVSSHAHTDASGDWPVSYHSVILIVTYIEHDPAPAKTCADFERQKRPPVPLEWLREASMRVDSILCDPEATDTDLHEAAGNLSEVALAAALGGIRPAADNGLAQLRAMAEFIQANIFSIASRDQVASMADEFAEAVLHCIRDDDDLDDDGAELPYPRDIVEANEQRNDLAAGWEPFIDENESWN